MKKRIALWMIFLILPIYSSTAMAASIAAAWANGNSEPKVPGCIKEGDYPTFEVYVDAPVLNSITEDMLTINDYMFGLGSDVCELDQDVNMNVYGHHCSQEFSDLIVSELPYSIELHDSSGNVLDTKDVTIKTDSQGPAVSGFQIVGGEGVVGPNSDVTFKYSISDNCAGFKEGIVYIGGFGNSGSVQIKDSINVKKVSSYTVEKGIKISEIAFSWPEEGPVDVCVKARDWFEQWSAESTENCLLLKVDAYGPDIIGSLKINSRYTDTIVTNGQDPVSIAAMFKDMSSSISVDADFKALNGNENLVRGNCADTGASENGLRIFECAWSSVQATTGGSIEFKATDAFGNTKNSDKNVEVIIDTTKPAITDLDTGYSISGQKYARGINNRFKAAITEETAGLYENGDKVILGIPGGTRQAKNCSTTDSREWACWWENVDLSSAAQNSVITINVNAEDTVGNAAEEYVTNVKVDKNIPELQDISNEKTDDDWLSPDNFIIITPSYEPLSDSSIVGTSTLIITALAKDDTGVKAFADLTGLVDGAIPYSDATEDDWETCSRADAPEGEEGTFWRCEINTEAIKRLNEDRTIGLYFKDSVENIKIEEITVKIKTTGISLLANVEVASNEYPISATIGKIIGTSTLNIRALVTSPVNPSPAVTAKVTFPEEIGIKKGGQRENIPADSCGQVTEDGVEKVECWWNTQDWTTGTPAVPSGAVPKEGTYTLAFNFEDNLGNRIEKQNEIQLEPPKELQLMDIRWEQNLGAVFPGGIPPHFRDMIVAGQEITFTAEINHPGYPEENEEAASISEAYADFSDLLKPSDGNDWKNVAADSCIFVSAADSASALPHWECVWRLAGVKEEADNDARAYFRFKDVAGNTWPINVIPSDSSSWHKETYKVIGLKDITGQKYWEVKSVTVFPDIVDRQTAGLLSQKVETRIELRPTSSCRNCEVLSIANRCTDTGYVDGDIKIKNKYTESPWLSFNLKVQDYRIDQIKFDCTLQIRFKEDDYIYTAPAEVNISFALKFYNYPLGEVSQKMKNKINNAMEGGLAKEEFIGKASKVLGQFVKICRVVQTLTEVSNLLGKIEVATSWMQYFPPTEPAAGTINKATDAADITSKGFVKTMYKFCQYATCDKLIWDKAVFGEDGYRKFLGEYGFSGGEQARKYSGYSWMEEYNIRSATFWPRDPSESLPLSVATGCLPGIIFNLQKMRNIDCGYAVCLYENAKKGISTAPCETEKSFGYCKYVYGQIFEVIPFKEFFEWVSKSASQIFEDPLKTIMFFTEYNCRKHSDNYLHGSCVLGDAGRIVEIIGAMKRARDEIRMDPPQDICKEASRIIQLETTASESEPPIITG